MPEALTRSLSLTQIIFYGVGTIVGAGIYTIIGSAAGLAGSALWVSMLVARAAAFLTSLSYAKLISMLPKAGAEYQFLKAAFPKAPLISFLAGGLIALNAAATSATVSLAFAGYLKVFLDVSAMGVVGSIALFANLVCFFLLYRHRGDNLKMSSTWLCSRNDLIANAGVLLAAASSYLLASRWPDIIVGVVIASLFLSSALKVLGQATREARALA